jgi:hypothetical protein
LARALEGGEHRVEAGGQPPELILLTGLDAMAEVLCARDAFGGAHQAAHGYERSPGDEQSERGRQRDPAEAHERQHQLQVAERAVHVGQRQGDLQSSARGSHSQHPRRRAGDRPVAEELVALAFGKGPCRRRHWDQDALFFRAQNLAVRARELRKARGAAEPRRGHHQPWGLLTRAAEPRRGHRQPSRFRQSSGGVRRLADHRRGRGQRQPAFPFQPGHFRRADLGQDLDRLGQAGCDLRAQAVVDARAQFIAGHDVYDHRGEHHRRRHRAGREQNDPPAKAHRRSLRST